VNKRDFISGIAAAWPLAARAQKNELVRRIGMLQRWGIIGVKIVRWVRHWDEKHQPIIILINFLVLDRARLRGFKLGLFRGEGFADENLVPTVPQRMSFIFEHRKISTERFACSADFRLNFVLCIERCDSSSIYLSHIYGHGLLPPADPLHPQQHNLAQGHRDGAILRSSLLAGGIR